MLRYVRVYAVIRVPLNLIVVVINVISLSSEFTFLACTILLAVALFGSFAISRLSAREAKAQATLL